MASNIRTRKEFAEYCLRRLGWPVIDINVSEEQVDDRIDDSLQFFQDYHFDGTEKMFLKHRFTQEDIDRRWIYCPDAVNFVTGVFPWDDSNSSVNMFDLRYQLRLHDLYDFTSVSYVSYEITMQHIRTLNLLFSGTPQFRFNRKLNKLYLDIDWARDAHPGKYCVVECYRSLMPDTMELTGTLQGVEGSKTVIGIGTKFDQELLEGDIFTVKNGSENFGEFQVNKIISPTELELVCPCNLSGEGTAVKEGLSDIWNDRFLKQYATAKIKYQWGSNLSKFSGIQMPGGVTLDGVTIKQEALEEINKLEEEMHVLNVLPSEMFLG